MTCQIADCSYMFISDWYLPFLLKRSAFFFDPCRGSRCGRCEKCEMAWPDHGFQTLAGAREVHQHWLGLLGWKKNGPKNALHQIHEPSTASTCWFCTGNLFLNSLKVALKLSLFVFPGEEAEGPWQRGIAYKGFSPMVKDDSHIINPWLWTALGHGPHVRYAEYVRIWKAST